jgi:hypothetical protein
MRWNSEGVAQPPGSRFDPIEGKLEKVLLGKGGLLACALIEGVA